LRRGEAMLHFIPPHQFLVGERGSSKALACPSARRELCSSERR